jgi:hypothetical protein
MGQKSKTTFQKQEREKEKRFKQRDKEARRVEARKAKAERKPVTSDEDPDLAGIKPGPQPLPEQWQWAARLDSK